MTDFIFLVYKKTSHYMKQVETVLMGPLMGHKNLAVKLQSIYTNAIIRVQLNPALQEPV